MFQECTKIILPGVSLFKLPSADFSTPKCHFSKSVFLLASMVMRGRSCYMAFSCWNLTLEEGNGLGLWVKLKNVVKAFDHNNSKPFSRRFSGTVLQPWLLSPPPSRPPVLMDRTVFLLPRLLGVWLKHVALSTCFIMNDMPEMG